MASRAGLAPPLSLAGTLAALRRPTAQDLAFSAKATVAVGLCLLIAFSQNLDTPYWSALTVYVLVSQPQAGAVRSKALFRLAGTLAGGLGAILLAGLFGNEGGAFLIATIASIVLATWAKALDRTPAGYTWFVIALTLAVVAIAQAQSPATIFLVAATRMGEIGLAVLAIELVDSVAWPRAATPDFLRSMADWGDRAAQWAAAALSSDERRTPEAHGTRRAGLQALAGSLGALPGLAVQLPWDIGPRPPSGRNLRFIRLTLAQLVADLSAADLWRQAEGYGPSSEATLSMVRGWVLQRPAPNDHAVRVHASEGGELHERLVSAAVAAATAGYPEHATGLFRLAGFVDHWRGLEQALHAVATGARLPPALRAAADRARPTISIDYVLALLDAMPLALGLGALAALWYFTTWTSSVSAMLFTVISLGFVGGTPGAVRSAWGIVLWIALTCAISLAFEFAVLPRITDFPMLAAVLAVGLVPLTLLMAMSPAGLLILANGFALLGLQAMYAADAQGRLETAFGAVAGCVVAAATLALCQFDRARFSARRLASALRRDLLDVAQARRALDPDRLVSLGVDRIALLTASVGALPQDDPLRRENAVGLLRVAVELLQLRQASVSGDAFEAVRAVIAAFAERKPVDLKASQAQLDAAIRSALGASADRATLELLAALIGLRAAVSAWECPESAAGAGL